MLLTSVDGDVRLADFGAALSDRSYGIYVRDGAKYESIGLAPEAYDVRHVARGRLDVRNETRKAARSQLETIGVSGVAAPSVAFLLRCI